MNNSPQNKTKEGFMLYRAYYDSLKDLTDEELGQLFRLIFEYQNNPENPMGLVANPAVKMAFNFIANQFRVDANKYEKRVQANQENGKLGGRPPKVQNPENPMGFEETHQNPNEKEKEKDNEKEKEKVKDKEAEIDILFSEFWGLYPEKKNKKKARALYGKLYKNHEQIMAGLRDYVGHHKFLEGKKKLDNRVFIPFWKHPTTWLNNACWEDEYGQEYKKEQDRIKANEAAREFEAREKIRKEADNRFSAFRKNYLDNKFGVNNWTMFKPFKRPGAPEDTRIMISEHPEVNQEVAEAFKAQNPNDYETLFKKETENEAQRRD